jgi:hypothetical protein
MLASCCVAVASSGDLRKVAPYDKCDEVRIRLVDFLVLTLIFPRSSSMFPSA